MATEDSVLSSWTHDEQMLKEIKLIDNLLDERGTDFKSTAVRSGALF
jgi:hypothetical protein